MLGTTYVGYQPALMARVMPLVDALEVAPEVLRTDPADPAALDANALAELRDCARDVPLVIHGVGLSIGTAAQWNESYLITLDALLNAVPVQWHSEHLGYTTVDGAFLNTMLPVPWTDEALDLVSERVVKLLARYCLPMLVENVAPLLPDPPGDMTAAAFCSALAARTGCGLLLDVYNLECAQWNNGFEIDTFLKELQLPHVREIHVACGVENQGLLTDVHSRATRPCTVALAQRVLADECIAPPLVIFEFLREALPGLGVEGVAGELVRLRCALAA
jgi:uncharacterized protein